MYYDLGHTIQIWVSFNIALLCKTVPPLLPRFPSSNVISSCSWRLCTVWWRRSLKSPHKEEKASELQRSNVRVFMINIFCICFMYSWVYNGAPQPCLFTLYGPLHTDDTPSDNHFCIPFYMGSCTRRLNLLPVFKQERTSGDCNEDQPKHQNRNFLKTFCNYLWWHLYTTFI